MGRALFAVGALLALFFVILGVVVYFTRSEDQLAIDNQLAENLTRAISQSEELDRDVDLRRLAPFPWSRVLVVAPDTTASAVSRELGSEYKADLRLPSASTVFVFANGNALARVADYRGRGTFEGFDEPIASLAAPRGRVPRAGSGCLPEMSALAALDLGLDLSKKEEAARLDAAQKRLLALRLRLGGQLGDDLGPPVCVLFEGWDASGKGGAIKRLVSALDPRHVRVAQFAAPTPDELRHHWLGRFWPVLPGRGGMAVLDRSWYGRVMVERVEGFASPDEWRRAYREICEFERLLTVEGTLLIKFWLHISEAEQLARFEARAANPLKRWKLTDEDWRNRAKRPEYEAAVEEMVALTSTREAPWTLVEGDSKRYARVKVIETVCAEIEAALGG